MTAIRKTDRLDEVDALRGLAALSVMLYHFIYRYPAPNKPKAELIRYIFGYFPIPEFYLGLIPVYLFFMISGFVIFMTAEKCRSIAVFGYRRFSRLYPVYWGALIVMGLTLLLFGSGQEISPYQFFFNLTMFQEYFGVPHISGVFWSLTVELSFYILVAGVIGLGLMPYRKYLLLVWSLLIFFYGFYSIPNPIPWPVVHLLVLDYGHFFVYGIAVYELWKARRSAIDKTDPFMLLLILISTASSLIRYPAIAGIILLGVHGVFYFAVMQKLQFLRNSPMVYLGTISYALYLVHEVIGIAMMDYLALPRAAEVVATSAAALIIAMALTRWVERPTIEWLRINRPAWAS